MNFANVTSLTIPEGSVKAIYCNDVKLWGVGGTYENTITGVPPLTLANCTGDDLVSWSIVGNTIQDGTPSPENPVDVQGVGDWDDTEQKYKIPVKTNDTTTNIYLNSPLMQGETLSSDGEREVEWGKLVFTGDETFNYSAISGLNRFEFSYAYQTKDYKNGFCNLYKYQFKNIDNTVYHTSSNTSKTIFFFDSRFSNVVDFKSYLSDQYNAGTPVTVWYQLATTTTETFTPPSIPTETGTTVLDTDCVVAPSEMTLTFMSTTPQNEETR